MTTLWIKCAAHALTAFLVLYTPWWGCRQIQNAQKRLRAGDPLGRVRLYRSLIIEQFALIAVVCGLWRVGGIPAASLGIGAPRSWWGTAGLGVVLGGFLVRSALRSRPKAERLRGKLGEQIGVLVPDSIEEHRWFACVSVGAGIAEELAYRGFLFYYFSVYLPQMHSPGIVLLAALIFGLGHLYQGWQGVVKTALVGLILAGFYLVTGSLLLPIVLHALTDLQISLIFWPAAPGSGAAQEAA